MNPTAQVTPIAQFTPAQWTALASLCSHVSEAIAWPLELVAGSTDDGQTWAALCINEGPAGNNVEPGPLATIAIYSDRPDLYMVSDSWGQPVLSGLTFDQAVTLAEYTAGAELCHRAETLDGRVCNYPDAAVAVEVAADLLGRLAN